MVFGRLIPRISRGRRHSGQPVSIQTALTCPKQFMRVRARPAFSPFQADDASSTLVGRSEMHWQVKPNMWRLFIPSFHFDGYSGSSCNKRATRRARSRVQHSLWTGESEDARQLHRGFWSLSASTPLFRPLRSTTFQKTDAQVIVMTSRVGRSF
jgi:hypothetical protein